MARGGTDPVLTRLIEEYIAQAMRTTGTLVTEIAPLPRDRAPRATPMPLTLSEPELRPASEADMEVELSVHFFHDDFDEEDTLVMHLPPEFLD